MLVILKGGFSCLLLTLLSAVQVFNLPYPFPFFLHSFVFLSSVSTMCNRYQHIVCWWDCCLTGQHNVCNFGKTCTSRSEVCRYFSYRKLCCFSEQVCSHFPGEEEAQGCFNSSLFVKLILYKITCYFVPFAQFV